MVRNFMALVILAIGCLNLTAQEERYDFASARLENGEITGKYARIQFGDSMKLSDGTLRYSPRTGDAEKTSQLRLQPPLAGSSLFSLALTLEPREDIVKDTYILCGNNCYIRYATGRIQFGVRTGGSWREVASDKLTLVAGVPVKIAASCQGDIIKLFIDDEEIGEKKLHEQFKLPDVIAIGTIGWSNSIKQETAFAIRKLTLSPAAHQPSAQTVAASVDDYKFEPAQPFVTKLLDGNLSRLIPAPQISFQEGFLDYRPRTDLAQKKAFLQLKKSFIRNGGFTISFDLIMRTNAPKFNRDMYILGGRNMFFRYTVDKRGLQFGVQQASKWYVAETPYGKFVAEKDKQYKVKCVYDGTKVLLSVDGQTLGSAEAPADFKPDDLYFGVCGWSDNLKWEGDFRLRNLHLAAAPEYDAAPIKTEQKITESGFADRPSAVIPKVIKVPSLKGIPRGGDWERAAVLGNPVYRGEFEVTAKLDFKTYLLYDDANIYIGFTVDQKRAPIALTPPTAKGDDGLERDDSVQVIFSIPGAPNNPYQFKLNCLGQRDDAAPRHTFSWNGDWQGNVAVNGKQWSATFAIPFKNFTEVPPTAGTRWGANFCAFLAGENYIGFCWSPNFQYHHLDGQFGSIEFGTEQTPSSRFGRIEQQNGVFKVSGVMAGSGMVRALLFPEKNEKEGRENLGGFVITDFDEAGRGAVAQASLNLKQADDWELGLPPVAPGRYWLKILQTTSNGKLLAQECKPVVVANDISVEIKKYPVRRAASVWITAHHLPGEKTKPAKASVRLLDKDGKELNTWSKPLTEFNRRIFIMLDELQNAAAYTAELSVYDTNDKAVITRSYPFEIPARPVWADTTAGLADGSVPKPWIPITVSGNRLNCWGRTYDFRNALFPQAIISQQKPVLGANGIRLALTDEKGNTTYVNKADMAPEFRNSASGDRAEFTSNATNPNGKVNVSGFMDFDGFMKYSLKLFPAANLKRVALEIFISNECAEFLQPLLTTASRDAAGRLPKEPVAFDMMTPKNRRSEIWIASDDIGFYFTTDTYGNWQGRPGRMVEIIPQKEGGVLLRLNFYDQDKVLKEERQWNFFIEAAPIRPFPDDYYEVGGRICNGFSPMLGRTPVESDAVKTLDFKTAGNDWDLAFALKARKDLREYHEFEPLPYFAYNDVLLHIPVPGKSRMTLRYVNQTGEMVLDTPWGKLAHGAPWGKDELHAVRIGSAGGELSMSIDGQTPRKLKFDPAVFQNNLKLQLGSVTGSYLLDSLKFNGAEQLDGALSLQSNARTRLDELADLGFKTMIYFENWSHMQAGGVSRWQPIIKEAVDAAHKRGIKVILYFGFEIADVPEMQDYIDEIVADINASSRYYAPARMNTFIASLASPQLEYYVYNMERLKREVGIDGVYLDGSLGLNGSNNPAFGCGYELPDGSWGFTTPVERIRELARRIYNIFIPDGGIVKAHVTFTPPTSAFVTTQFLGEHLGFTNRPWVDMAELIDDNAARAIYAGQNSGVSTEICLQLIHSHIAESNPGWYPRAAAWFNLYRSGVNNLIPYPKQWSQNADELHRKEQLSRYGASKARWVPFWKLTGKVVTTDPALRMSLWQRSDKGMIWAIQNNSNQKVSGRIGTIAEFAPLSDATAVDLKTDQAIPLNKDGVDVEIPAFEGALIFVGNTNNIRK